VSTFLAHKKALTVVALVAIAAVMSVCCSASLPGYYGLYLQVACTGGGSPARSFGVEELLLDESAFPEGWKTRGPFEPDDGLPAERVAVDFDAYPNPDTSLAAWQEVYRFWGGTRCADIGYRSEGLVWFAPWPGRGPWRPPTELSYQSAVAGRFRLECCAPEGSSMQTCQAMGEYEEYLVVFRVDVDARYPDHMGFGDVERILVAIDKRMAVYLDKGTY